jgi:hypothetical protein
MTPTASMRPRAMPTGLVTVLLGTLIALACWRIVSIAPIGDIDGSWRAGLSLAVDQGLRFGSDLLFTYGPLGVLTIPQLYDPRLGAIAWLLVGGIQVGLCIVVVHASYRATGAWRTAVPVAIVGGIVTIAMPPLVGMTCLVMAGMVRLLRPGPTPSARVAAAIAAGLGLLAGIVALTKLNDGATILAITGLTAIGMVPVRWTVPAYALGAVVGASVGWFGTGQRIEDFVPFAGGGLHILLGYATAMAIPTADRGWHTLVLVAVVAMVVLAARSTTRGWRPTARIVLWLALAVIVYTGYRHGFVRHAPSGFFAAITLIVPWFLAWQPVHLERRIWMGLVLAILTIATARIDIDRLRPLERASSAVDQLTTIVVTDRRTALIRDSREALQAQLAIPPAMLEAIGRRSIHIAPIETSVAWAHPRLRWSPAPVFQHYQAYTAHLDGVNGSRLGDPVGPAVVLREARSTIDSRSEWYEAPETAMAMVCDFRPSLANARWLVLERAANRCSEPAILGSRSVRPGEPIPVPQPTRSGQLITVRIRGVADDALSRARSFLGQPAIWSIRLADVGTYRLVPATAVGPLIVARSTHLGYGRGFRPPPSTMAVTILSGSRVGAANETQPDVTLTVEFAAIDVAP